MESSLLKEKKFPSVCFHHHNDRNYWQKGKERRDGRKAEMSNKCLSTRKYPIAPFSISLDISHYSGAITINSTQTPQEFPASFVTLHPWLVNSAVGRAEFQSKER